jgi:hypothetical protein
MVSRKLMGVWAALDFLLLVAGAVALSLSLVWRAHNTLMNMILSPADLTGKQTHLGILPITNLFVLAGTILGVALLVTCAISVGAIVQKNHVTIGLVILNYALLLDAIGIVIIGTFVWFFTLQERANFHRLWLQANPQTRITLQDQVCCLFDLLMNANDFL